MQRGSDRLSVHKDEEMKHELRGMIRSGRPTRVEEWHDPEPGADDDPVLATGPVPDDGERSLRFELARHLGRRSFPADRDGLVRALERSHAPDGLTDRVRGLPDGATYRSAYEVARELSGGPAR